MENPKQYTPIIDPWNTINPWTIKPTTTPRGPHYPAEYQRPSQVQKPVQFGSRSISWLRALDIIERLDPIFHAGLVSGTINWLETEDIIKSMDPDHHARIVEHAKQPPSQPPYISPRKPNSTTAPKETPWESPCIKGDYLQVLSLLAKYQNGCANPSLKQIARAEKVFSHMLFWGAFMEVEPSLYQLLPLEELLLIFGSFYGYEELEGIVGFFDEFEGLEQ
jgi:hypothetical protein